MEKYLSNGRFCYLSGRRPVPFMVTYRFYILNRYEHITDVHLAECEGLPEVERTAAELIAERVACHAVEAWEKDKRVFRATRTALGVNAHVV